MALDSAHAVTGHSSTLAQSAMLRVVGLTGCALVAAGLWEWVVLFGAPRKSGVLAWQSGTLAVAVMVAAAATRGLVGSWWAASTEVASLVCASLAALGAARLQWSLVSVWADRVIWFVLLIGVAVWGLVRGSQLLAVPDRVSLGRAVALAVVVGMGFFVGSQLIALAVAWGGNFLTGQGLRMVVSVTTVPLVLTFALLAPAGLKLRDSALLLGVGAAGAALWELVTLGRYLPVLLPACVVVGIAVSFW